jgi:hypothetical protein
MGNGYLSLRHQGLELAGDEGNALNPIVDKEGLTISF